MDETTRVIFKMTPVNDCGREECIAFLLDEPANPGNILSYMAIGQHGEASVGFYHECTPATPAEYQDLLDELKSIGYNLEITTIAEEDENEPSYKPSTCPHCKKVSQANIYNWNFQFQVGWLQLVCGLCGYNWREIWKFGYREDMDGNAFEETGE